MTQETGICFYPPIEPYETFYEAVGDGHELYVECVGNPDGQPALFLHGGPGSSTAPAHRQFFDPVHYRLTLFHQRGSGNSRPHASLHANTTWDLIADIERLRERLGVDRWLLFGGSWGSTLALAYAISHPNRVSGLILRGIFLCRPAEIRWFYQEGCHWVFPEFWERFQQPIPPEERHDMLHAYFKRLTGDDAEVRQTAARAWSTWEGATCKLLPNQAQIDHYDNPFVAEAMARIECHYFVNNAFFSSDNYLLDHAHTLGHIPTWIVHGRYDMVCPVRNAIELKAVMPHAELFIMPYAGHGVDEAGTLDQLLAATEHFKQYR